MSFSLICMLLAASMAMGRHGVDIEAAEKLFDTLYKAANPALPKAPEDPLTAHATAFAQYPLNDNDCAWQGFVPAITCLGDEVSGVVNRVHGMIGRIDVTDGADGVVLMNLDGPRVCHELDDRRGKPPSPCGQTYVDFVFGVGREDDPDSLDQEAFLVDGNELVDCTGPNGCVVWAWYEEFLLKKRGNQALRGRGQLAVVPMAPLPPVVAGFKHNLGGLTAAIGHDDIIPLTAGMGTRQYPPGFGVANLFDGTGKPFVVKGAYRFELQRVDFGWVFVLVTFREPQLFNAMTVWPSGASGVDPQSIYMFATNRKYWPAGGPYDDGWRGLGSGPLIFGEHGPQDPSRDLNAPGTLKRTFEVRNDEKYLTYALRIQIDDTRSDCCNGDVEIGELRLFAAEEIPRAMSARMDAVTQMIVPTPEAPDHGALNAFFDNTWASFINPSGANSGLIVRFSWVTTMTSLRVFPALTNLANNPVRFEVFGTNEPPFLEQGSWALDTFTRLGDGQLQPQVELPPFTPGDRLNANEDGDYGQTVQFVNEPVGWFKYYLILFPELQGGEDATGAEVSEVRLFWQPAPEMK